MKSLAGDDIAVRVGAVIVDGISSTATLDLSYDSMDTASEKAGLLSVLGKLARSMRVDVEGSRMKLMVESSRGWACLVESDVEPPAVLNMFMKAAKSGMLVLSVGVHNDADTFFPMVVFMVDMKTCAFYKVSSMLKETARGAN